nr:endonuclease/exonuclease/phosphatase family protein [Thiorhodovibrio winogradskyi]
MVTFNIWFGEFRWRERLAALLDIIRDCRADVITLQEVMPRHLERILRADWVRDEFGVSDVAGETLQPHGVLTLSRLPVRGFGLYPLPSAKARKLLIAEIGSGERALRIGNLHLESSGGATPVRLQQLDTVLPRLHDAQHAVLMGDFNFDPLQRREQSRVEAHFRDLWAELRGDDPGYTENTDVNRMRLLHKNKEKQVRFDRVLLRASRPGWAPESIRLIGTRPIDADQLALFPSDHFGLAASLSWDAGEGDDTRKTSTVSPAS